MSEYNSSNEYQSKPKLAVLRAVLFGLLTFVITPITIFVVAIPFYFLGQISEDYNPLIIVAGIFGLRELSGFFCSGYIIGTICIVR